MRPRTLAERIRADALLAWLLVHAWVFFVIPGATKLDHPVSNVKAADWTLTTEGLRVISAVLDSQRHGGRERLNRP
jgi:aryl-alcohol dehydrogenase-like predicted oxidoreductase